MYLWISALLGYVRGPLVAVQPHVRCELQDAVSGVLLHLSEEMFTLLDLCVSSLRRGHANLLCIVPILTDDPRRESSAPLPVISCFITLC